MEQQLQYFSDMPKIAGNVAFWEKQTSGGTWIMSGMQQRPILVIQNLQRSEFIEIGKGVRR